MLGTISGSSNIEINKILSFTQTSSTYCVPGTQKFLLTLHLLNACCVLGAELGAGDGDKQGAFHPNWFLLAHLKSTYCVAGISDTKQHDSYLSAFDDLHVCRAAEMNKMSLIPAVGIY